MSFDTPLHCEPRFGEGEAVVGFEIIGTVQGQVVDGERALSWHGAWIMMKFENIIPAFME